MTDNRVAKEDVRDDDFADKEELVSDGYFVYRNVDIATITSATRLVTINPSSAFDLLTNVDNSLQVGDRVEIFGNAAAGFYTVSSIPSSTTFIVNESIANATGGTADLIHPAGATLIGVDGYSLELSTSTILQDVLEDLDDIISQSLFPVVLKSDTTITGFNTINDAILQAISGDTICLKARTFNESITLPANITLVGENKNQTIIAGDVPTGSRIVTSGAANILNITVSLPTDSSAGIINSSGLVEINNVDFIGNGGLGVGVINNAPATTKVINCVYRSGNCETIIQCNGRLIDIANFLILGGTVQNSILLTSGSAFIQADNIIFDQVGTKIDGIEIQAGTFFGQQIQFTSSVQNAIHVSGNNVSFDIFDSLFLNTDVNDLLVDVGLTGSNRFTIRDCNLNKSKISAPSAWLESENLYLNFVDQQDNVNRNIANFEVGIPEVGKSFAAGQGFSTVSNIVIFNTDSTASVISDGGNITNITTSGTKTFQGVGANHTIIAGFNSSSLLRHFGWELEQSVAAVGGEYIFEFWNGAAWQTTGVQASSVQEQYRYGNDVFLRAGSVEYLRFGIDQNTSWASKIINGINAFYIRVRISVGATTAPVFTSFELIPSHVGINQEGRFDLHGLSLFRKTLQNSGNVFGETGGVASTSPPIGSGGVPTGWNHNIKNSLLNGNGDAIYYQFVLPRGICTAFPLFINVYYTVTSAFVIIPAQVTVSVLPRQVSGVPVADPSGGIVPVPRSQLLTGTLTADPADAETIPLTNVLTNIVHRFTTNGTAIDNFYEGDIVFIRVELEDDGTLNQDLLILALEINGVVWTLGERF